MTTMPLPMMTSAAFPVCPRCQSLHCRRSRWASRNEKEHHQASLRPYRCLDCQHRFLAHDSNRLHWLRLGLLLLLATLLLVGAFAAVVFRMHQDSLVTASTTSPPDTPPGQLSDTRRAAEQGETEAQYRLGRSLFLDGASDLSKANEALHWLQLAAGKGHPEALVYLGRVYRSGVGAPQNFARAAQYMEQAAHTGHPPAMLELGRLYRDGVGKPRDIVQAYVWLNRAAAAFDEDAIRERDDLHRFLTTTQLEEAQQLSLQLHLANPPTAPHTDGKPAGN
jgi:hypothetical protein